MRRPKHFRAYIRKTVTITVDGRERTFERGRVYTDVSGDQWRALVRVDAIAAPPTQAEA